MENKSKKIISILSTIIIMLLVSLGMTYSYFVAKIKENNKTETVLKAGSLELIFTGTKEINADNIYPGQTFTKTFSVENPNNVSMKFNIYLENVNNTFEKDLVYLLKANDENVTDTRILPKTREGKTYILYDLEINANEKIDYSLEITFVNKDELQNTQGASFNAILGIDNENSDKVATKNDKIINAFEYNNDTSSATYCVNGTEETCKKSTCYRNLDTNSCTAGTIVIYAVNEDSELAFNVLFDDGETMRIQQINKTTESVSWSSVNNSSTATGPYGVLNALETKTANWINVPKISYNLGTTVFATNKYTACLSYNVCSNNQYNLEKANVLARIITVQEAAKLGCSETASSCPSWLTNGDNIWTSNASSSNSTNAWRIDSTNKLGNILSGCDGFYNNNCGSQTFGKAVIEIEKM